MSTPGSMQPSPTGPQPHQPSPPQSPGQSPAGPSAAQQRSNVGKLFVGQVPYIATEELLQPLFAPYGSLQEIKIMRDPEGRSRGCAWVRYETQEQAQQAIEALHDKHTIPPQTNMLQVRFAQTSRTNENGGGRGFGGGRGGYNNSRGGFNQNYQQSYQNQHYPQQPQGYYYPPASQQQGGYVAYQNAGWSQSAASGYGRGGAQQGGYGGYQQQQSYPQQQVIPPQQRYPQGEQPQMYAFSQPVYPQPAAAAVNQW